MKSPNVLLLVMDTARASNVLPSVNPDIMPTINRIAEEGTMFTQAMTTAPWTLPSHASLFTGQYTADHGTHAGTKAFEPDVPTIAEYLQTAGYQTVAISNNVWISPEFGFDRGFEDFYVGLEPIPGGAPLTDIAKQESVTAQARSVLEKLSVSNALPTILNATYSQFLHKRYDTGAFVATRQIKRWLRKEWQRDRPFFMFVNLLEPHLEYDPPRSFRYKHLPDGITRKDAESANQDAWQYVCGEIEMTDREFAALEGLYNGELAYLDHRLKQLYEFFAAEGILDKTVIILTSDHGENIGEHGLMDHQYCLYDTLLHIPLVVRYPDTILANETVSELVELRDLYPTIASLAEIADSTPASVSDHVLPTIGQDTANVGREYTIAEYLVPQPPIDRLANRVGIDQKRILTFDRALRSIRTDRWKFIEGTDGSEELYDIRSDPAETTDRSADQPSIVTDLQERLRAERGRLEREDRDRSTQMNKRTRQHLEDLGYI